MRPALPILLTLLAAACAGEGASAADPVPSQDVVPTDVAPDQTVTPDAEPDPGPSDIADAPDAPDAPDAAKTIDSGPLDVSDADTSDPEEVDGDTAPEIEVADTEDVADVEDDADAVEPGPCPAADESDVPLVLGQIIAQDFSPLAENDPIEIAQGPQGGVHLEIAIRVDLPEAFSDSLVYATVQIETWQEGGAAPVGSYHNKEAQLYPAPDDRHWSGPPGYNVIFEQDEAVHYDQQVCCVRATIGVKDGKSGPVVLAGAAALALSCVDYF